MTALYALLAFGAFIFAARWFFRMSSQMQEVGALERRLSIADRRPRLAGVVDVPFEDVKR
jgi:hypothetical protein